MGPGKSDQVRGESHCFKKWCAPASPPKSWYNWSGHDLGVFLKVVLVSSLGWEPRVLVLCGSVWTACGLPSVFKDLSRCWITSHLPVCVPWWRWWSTAHRWYFLPFGSALVGHFFLYLLSKWMTSDHSKSVQFLHLLWKYCFGDRGSQLWLSIGMTWGTLTTSHTQVLSPESHFHWSGVQLGHLAIWNLPGWF